MAHVNCPNCKTRLRAPDTKASVMLRCPACRQTFTASSRESGPPGGEGQNTGGPAANGEEPGQKFSKADEAMLRDFGSGTGLLELTRETYDTGLDAARSGAQEDQAAGGRPGFVPPPMDDPHRQFQIVATALSLANKLVQTHKAEAARARRSALLAWISVAALAALGATAIWYGTRLAGSADLEQANALNQLELERAKAANLTANLADGQSRLAEEKARASKVSETLENVRKDLKAVQGELVTLSQAVGEGKATAQILTTDLKAARNKITELTAELARAKSTPAPETQRAPGAATQPAPETQH